VLRDYVRAKAWYFERQAIEGWLSGKQPLQAEQEARGRIIELHFLADLRLDHVQALFETLERIRAAD